EGRHRIEEIEARVLRLRRGGRRRRVEPAQLRDELREVWRAGPARDAGWALRASGPEIGPDHLNPGPVGRSAFALPAPPPEHEVTPRRRLARQLLHQAGLADARLPDDEEEASAARAGVFQARAQLHELAVSTDEDRLRALEGRRHRRDHSALAHSRQGRDAPPASRSRLEAGGKAAPGSQNRAGMPVAPATPAALPSCTRAGSTSGRSAPPRAARRPRSRACHPEPEEQVGATADRARGRTRAAGAPALIARAARR